MRLYLIKLVALRWVMIIKLLKELLGDNFFQKDPTVAVPFPHYRLTVPISDPVVALLKSAGLIESRVKGPSIFFVLDPKKIDTLAPADQKNLVEKLTQISVTAVLQQRHNANPNQVGRLPRYAEQPVVPIARAIHRRENKQALPINKGKPEVSHKGFNKNVLEYRKDLAAKEQNLKNKIEELKLTPEEQSRLSMFENVITFDFIENPVLLHGKFFDITAIEGLEKAKKDKLNEKLEDPYTREKFTLGQVQPGKLAFDYLEAFAELIKVERSAKEKFKKLPDSKLKPKQVELKVSPTVVKERFKLAEKYDALTSDMKLYLETSLREENLKSKIDGLQLRDHELNKFEKFIDLKTKQFFNVPVIYNGIICEFEELISRNPSIPLDQIQSGRLVHEMFDMIARTVELERQLQLSPVKQSHTEILFQILKQKLENEVEINHLPENNQPALMFPYARKDVSACFKQVLAPHADKTHYFIPSSEIDKLDETKFKELVSALQNIKSNAEVNKALADSINNLSFELQAKPVDNKPIKYQSEFEETLIKFLRDQGEKVEWVKSSQPLQDHYKLDCNEHNKRIIDLFKKHIPLFKDKADSICFTPETLRQLPTDKAKAFLNTLEILKVEEKSNKAPKRFIVDKLPNLKKPKIENSKDAKQEKHKPEAKKENAKDKPNHPDAKGTPDQPRRRLSRG